MRASFRDSVSRVRHSPRDRSACNGSYILVDEQQVREAVIDNVVTGPGAHDGFLSLIVIKFQF